MIHIYCGDGKGKTTAAVGLAVRMAGSGKKVLFGQFFKDGSSGEIVSLKQLPGITVKHCKTIPGRYVKLSEAQRLQVQKDYTNYLEMLLEESKDYDLLVLDEAVSACNHGTIPEKTILDYLKTVSDEKEIVLTGRNPSKKLTEAADYISEVKKIRHPFDDGIPARKGIEF